jgi:hypothetical protein
MRRLSIAVLSLLSMQLYAQGVYDVHTTFQTSREWRPAIDVRADAVMVYGVGGNPSDLSERIPFEERVRTWREKGYNTHYMTGIAWGEYQDYFSGEWDGTIHLDEGQVQQNGDTIWHSRGVPYIVPTKNFLHYLKERHIKRAIDAGITSIFLEEPEFWARAGYSDAFKREWEQFYGFPWRAQHLSPENTYLSNKLKYHLYFKALDEVFSYAKAYGKRKGMDVKCFVPTHSLVNYSQWMIVSPEASLASLSSVDGYIAQVWTGTAREPNYFNGIMKERVFETAFLEYGSMESMTAPTGRTIFFLTDPIEDWPRDWIDYKRNYEATFAAQLLYPRINKYEVMPWPERIYEGLYRKSRDSEEKAPIPRDYATQMQVMINTLQEMPQSDNRVEGPHGVGVMMSNSLMFQRFPGHEGYDDPQLSNFYGQTLPLLKRGVPVETVHMENLIYPETLKDIHLLVLSYSGMKPTTPESHEYITEWVKNGGILLYCGRDNDPFQGVPEWWNSGKDKYPTAAGHLFTQLGLKGSSLEGEYNVGKGKVCILRKDPKEFVLYEKGDSAFISLLQRLYQEASGEKLQLKHHFTLNRGPYKIISVLEESVDALPVVVKGCFIDLFDPEIPVCREKIVNPGEQALLYDIGTLKEHKEPRVLATAARVSEVRMTGNSYGFIAKSPLQTTNVMRILLPQEPDDCRVTGSSGEHADHTVSWDAESNTLFLSFENNPAGVNVTLHW